MLQLLESKLNSVTGFLILKGLCHNWLVQFVYNANYESLLAMELKKYLWTTKLTFVSKKHVSQALYETLQTAKINSENCWANKFSNITIAIRFNLLQVWPSVLPFTFAVLFIPSFDVSSDNFHVLVNLVAVPTDWILINFVTQLL